MISQLEITQYRKLKDITLTFKPTINVISGTNGTCKTSILHLIGNSFKPPKKSDVTDTNCISIIKSINNLFNPKIENLTHGDKADNDPAKGVSGPLYKTHYINDKHSSFRRHVSKESTSHRFRLIPPYRQRSQENLQKCPVIYLGLGRLVPIGELSNDKSINKISKQLPLEYLKIMYELYEQITGIKIKNSNFNNMASIKVRGDFTSHDEGIDSNTISSGEDNILIILTAIISLKYYYEQITSTQTIESVLLIDEFDATLHPNIQIKLLEILTQYSNDFKIQIIFTTHSLSVIEHVLKNRIHLLYLEKITGNNIREMDKPNLNKIKMNLYTMTKKDIYADVKIPIFTEDEEARLFLNIIFDKFLSEDQSFLFIKNLFHMVTANLGSGNLVSIFQDKILSKQVFQSIGILDGDQQSSTYKFTNNNGTKLNLNLNLITLPSTKNPEQLAFDHANKLFDEESQLFWGSETIKDNGFTHEYYRQNIKVQVESIDTEINGMTTSTNGVRREMNKKVFNDNLDFFRFVLINWVYDDHNSQEVKTFKDDLQIMFCRVRRFYGIGDDTNII